MGAKSGAVPVSVINASLSPTLGAWLRRSPPSSGSKLSPTTTW